MKNYIGFVNDHSGSMEQHLRAAIADYNANIDAVKDAATTEMLDTVVSVVAIGIDEAGRGGSGVVYWKELGVPFTEADLAYLQPKPMGTAVPAPVQLLVVPPASKPTPSPIPVTARNEYFETRDEARLYCNAHGIRFLDMVKNSAAPKARRWSVPAVAA